VHTIEHADGVVLVDTGMIDSTPELDEEGAPVPMPENIPRDVVCVINGLPRRADGSPRGPRRCSSRPGSAPPPSMYL
jgi:hypothetical protein